MFTTTRTLLAATALAVTVLAGCGGGDDAEPVAEAAAEPAAEPAPAVEPTSEEIVKQPSGLVTPQYAAELAHAGVTVIDVRTPEEYAEGHIDGAALIDFYEPGFVDEIAALPLDGEYLIYCRSGNRSGQTFGLVSELGFEQVWDMDGGVNAYGAAGLPLVR